MTWKGTLDETTAPESGLDRSTEVVGTPELIGTHLGEVRAAADALREFVPALWSWARLLADSLGSGGRLLVCGNGGSAAEAQHLTGEFVGRFQRDRRPYSALCLHSDTSAMTALLNDYGEQEVFARAVRAHGRAGDVFVGLSTSGRSHNVVAAAKTARDAELTTWAITGPGPTPLGSVCDDVIAVPAPNPATVQEMHLVLVHALCAAFDEITGVGRPGGEVS